MNRFVLGVALLFYLKLTSGLSPPKFNSVTKLSKTSTEPKASTNTPDITNNNHVEYFPEVVYPSSIFDWAKVSDAPEPMAEASSTNPNFDRSVSPEKFVERTKKKLNLKLNAALSSVPVLNTIDIPDDQDLMIAKKKGLNIPSQSNFLNNRQIAKKLSSIAKQPKYSQALSVKGAQLKNSSKWSKDIPVIQVVEDAISVVENIMLNFTLSSGPNSKPSVSVAEAERLMSILDNISEILSILNSLQGMEDSLYYNIKTGVVAKSAIDKEFEETVKQDPKGANNNETTQDVKIVDQAISIVGDLLSSNVLQSINKKQVNKNENTVTLTKQEADEMSDVVGTVKDILSILERLNPKPIVTEPKKLKDSFVLKNKD